MQRTMWFSLVVWLNWLALLAALLDMWEERRQGKPFPQIYVEW
jgi:hypothetical protein